MKTLHTLLWFCILLLMPAAVHPAPAASKRQTAKNLVDKAVAYYQEHGFDAAAELANDPQGPWVQGEVYVFLMDMDRATMVAIPFAKGLIGKDLMRLTDPNGVFIFVELVKRAKSETKGGWVDYMWPRPGETTPTPKHSYVRLVPGTPHIFGAGYYDD